MRYERKTFALLAGGSQQLLEVKQLLILYSEFLFDCWSRNKNFKGLETDLLSLE